MLDEKKINRQVFYLYAQIFDDTEEYPRENNTFRTFRAKDGYKMILDSVQVSTAVQQGMNNGVVEISDGNYYTGWDIWTGVENHETLSRCELTDYVNNQHLDLRNWEVKEFTIATRSTSITHPFKVCVIVWYYFVKMSKLETFFYALVHPRMKRYRKGYATTVEPSEDEE